jgi:hypothetical protein
VLARGCRRLAAPMGAACEILTDSDMWNIATRTAHQAGSTQSVGNGTIRVNPFQEEVDMAVREGVGGN